MSDQLTNSQICGYAPCVGAAMTWLADPMITVSVYGVGPDCVPIDSCRPDGTDAIVRTTVWG